MGNRIGLLRQLARKAGYSGWFIARYEIWVIRLDDKGNTLGKVDYWPLHPHRKATEREALHRAKTLKLLPGEAVELVDLGTGRHTRLRSVK